MNDLIMIKYGELTTKKGNRKYFINTLCKNIKSSLNKYDVEIKYDRSRMYIKTSKIEEIIEELKNIFGIHEIVVCKYTKSDIDSIKECVLDIVNNNLYKTFKIETKRSDKKFPISSMNFSCLIGSYILNKTNLKVDVHNPNIKINIEIREEGSYIYSNSIKGLGGYPVGIQGKGLLMLSGGIDSPVAGYLSLKRGIDIECLYFESPPHTSIQAKNKVINLAGILDKYSGNIKIHIIPFTKLQEEIYKKVPEEYNITIMRRMMYRIAEKYCSKINAKVILNGESIGQVASQTLTSMYVINNVTSMPVIRPVACFDKLEIIDIANKIGTYETSILPYEDCCTIFVPKHPVINPVLDLCIKYERRIDFEQLIDEAIENVEIIKNLDNKNYEELL